MWSGCFRGVTTLQENCDGPFSIEDILYNQRWPLIIVAKSNPSRAHNEVHQPRPVLPTRSVRPLSKINFLVSLQRSALRQKRVPFKLNRLLSLPPNPQRCVSIGSQISIFSGAIESVEHNLKLLRHSNPDESRLRHALRRNTPQNRQRMTRSELVELESRHSRTKISLTLTKSTLTLRVNSSLDWPSQRFFVHEIAKL
jgi:hypothetical protein